jgi:hypothetical protein
MTQVAEFLPSKSKALNSNPNTTKKNPQDFGSWSLAQLGVVEHLPSMCEDLGSISSIKK